MNWKPINEGSEHSFLTHRDKRKILDLAMNFAYNSWYLGEQMYDWDDAENDGSRIQLEEYLDSI